MTLSLSISRMLRFITADIVIVLYIYIRNFIHQQTGSRIVKKNN